MAFLSNPKVSILQATQCSDTICSVPALKKNGKVPVYSANPWIDRLHTQFTMKYHNKVSILLLE